MRVRNAIDLLGYTPHVAARNLAVRSTTTIGLLLPELSSSFFTPLLRGIEAAVRQTDYDLLIYANPRPQRATTCIAASLSATTMRTA